MCCFNTINGVSWQGCSLEPNNFNVTFGPSGGTVHLEGATEFYVFYRVEDKKVGKIRNYSIDCNIDAGGLPVYFLTGVNAAQSVGLLEGLIASNSTGFNRTKRRTEAHEFRNFRDRNASRPGGGRCA